jgi:ligand-binding sensor domain-containing protein
MPDATAPAGISPEAVARLPSYSQEDNLRFESVPLGSAFSQSAVHRIFQDSRGFMWFGTEDGLVKYDGYELTIYRHDPEDEHSLNEKIGLERQAL